MKTLRAAVKLRPKNQLTLPEQFARWLGVKPGDRLVLTVDEDQPGVIEVRPLRESYAGVALGVFGNTPEEIAEYIRGERASWGE